MSLRHAISNFRKKNLHQKMLSVASLRDRIVGLLYYRLVFGAFGQGTRLMKPTLLSNPEHIFIGNRALIRQGARLEVVLVVPEGRPRLIIGNDVNIEQNVHIVCHHRVSIGDRVSITANCAIVDTTHPFDNLHPGTKIGAVVQDDEGFVEIGEGTFLGIGCVVLPNVRIGRGCVVGANSVVTRDVPDYSVVAGAPARVLRSVRSQSPDEFMTVEQQPPLRTSVRPNTLARNS